MYANEILTHPDGARGADDHDRALLERVLRGQYQVVRLLGRGGMGAVYLARDIALHRVVAIKTLRWDLFDNPDERDRFRREARMSAHLSHPGIVPLFTFGETADLMYMVMRYVHGESLGARLRREGRIAHPDARRILAELTLALDYAHRHGVVHRDLKPENILLDGETGRPMLVDFGVAMRRWQDPVPGEPRRSVGTPRFMSPEQAAGDPGVDGRSDLYALGVVGHLMLTGALPPAGPDVHDASGWRGAPFDRAAVAAPGDLVDALERCLATDVSRRWPTARALHEALTGTAGVPARARWGVHRLGAMATRWARGASAPTPAPAARA